MPAPSSITTGAKYGHLSALERLPRNAPDGGAIWRFECVCGRKPVIRARHVARGDTTSCGCKRRTALGKSREGKGSTYYSYRAMLTRCYNKTHERYPDYGGRGIGVYFDWIGEGGFINFLRDMGERPPGKTLDRKDGSKDYDPDNCRWATAKVQAENRRPAKRKT